ncbi:DNA replication and repair protein RecO [Sulfurivirga caldicuralii]|uniref:DNA repair protein RecO n=1 Tax=Sulfurivirga caldicuralii TaxID=364032 RepID=A0A1N6EYW0_9GAMM|nr:recombination protein O N-terminal domain-containing protein [Sulfurivirga caldicuralii]SIN88184.1 DNA replication and repair protein RecO [Sulfurivirga caldicuralii]
MSWVEQPAWLLHRRPYRETSLLIDLLTPEEGRIAAVVKGVRGTGRVARQKQAWLQPAQPLQARWRARATQGLVSLRQLEPRGQGTFLQGEALLCLLYTNELLVRVLPEGAPVPEVFSAYEALVERLAGVVSRDDLAWALRRFEGVLVAALGVNPIFATDALERPLDAAARYRWDPEQGWLLAADGVSGCCLMAFAAQEPLPACLKEWKRMLRMLLAPWLGNRPLRAQQLWQATKTEK